MDKTKKISFEFKAGRKLPKYLQADSPIYKFPDCVGKSLPDPIYYYTSEDETEEVLKI